MNENNTHGNEVEAKTTGTTLPACYVHTAIVNDPQLGFDTELIDLTKILIQSESITDDVQNRAVERALDNCGTLTLLATASNRMRVVKAFQIGELLIWLKKKLTYRIGKRRVATQYKRLLNRIIDEHVAKILSAEREHLSPDAYDVRAESLRVSRRRQLNKYISLAECGIAILKYAPAGIEAALEVRYLLRDILKAQGKDPKIAPGIATRLLRTIEAQYPFPTLDQVRESDTRTEFRQHVDIIATIFQLKVAGFLDTEIEIHAVKSYAQLTGMAVEKSQADRFYNALVEVTETDERRDRLSVMLRANVIQRVKNDNPEDEDDSTAHRIADPLAAIVEWNKEHDIDDVIDSLKSNDLITSQLVSVRDIITNLCNRIHQSHITHNVQ